MWVFVNFNSTLKVVNMFLFWYNQIMFLIFLMGTFEFAFFSNIWVCIPNELEYSNSLHFFRSLLCIVEYFEIVRNLNSTNEIVFEAIYFLDIRYFYGVFFFNDVKVSIECLRIIRNFEDLKYFGNGSKVFGMTILKFINC